MQFPSAKLLFWDEEYLSIYSDLFYLPDDGLPKSWVFCQKQRWNSGIIGVSWYVAGYDPSNFRYVCFNWVELLQALQVLADQVAHGCLGFWAWKFLLQAALVRSPADGTSWNWKDRWRVNMEKNPDESWWSRWNISNSYALPQADCNMYQIANHHSILPCSKTPWVFLYTLVVTLFAKSFWFRVYNFGTVSIRLIL